MLTVTGLTKTFQTSEGPAQAVKGVDFKISEGEFYTLLGPSGCGKTTTLRCIAGLEKPDDGQIKIEGRLVADPSRRMFIPTHERDIGMVFQSYAIWPHLDVFDNVGYPLKVRRRRQSKTEIEDRVIEALSLVGMEDLAHRPSTKLSGGQQQRVALARALIHRPKLLLLDEPLSNLDAKLREQMRIELEDMVSRIAITTLYVTHDQSEALSMSDRIAVMSEGLIVQEGTPREVYNQPNGNFVAAFLGNANFITAAVLKQSPNGIGHLKLNDEVGQLQLSLPDQFKTGEIVEIVVRPENIRVNQTQPLDLTNVLEGKIERIDFQGGQSEFFVRVGSLLLRSVVGGATDATPGAQTWLTIDANQCAVFTKKNIDNADAT